MTYVKDKPAGGAAKRPAHRPVSIDARRVNVSLDDETIERARTLGDGNLSAGIRAAISAQREAEQMRVTFAAIKDYCESAGSPMALSIALTCSRYQAKPEETK